MKQLFFLLFSFAAFTAGAQYAYPCPEVPELNKKILAVLEPYKGKKIDRGECWDAAKLALNSVSAKWDGLYVFGRAIDAKKECIMPGDIIQFENALVEVRTETGGMRESYPHHTAIVYRVNGPGKLELIHQNTGYTGRKMGVSSMDLGTVVKGRVTIYRPVS